MAKKFDKSADTKKKAQREAAKAKTPEGKKKSEVLAEERKGMSIGLKSGLGVTATWNQMFEMNFKKHLTDEQLTELMQEEFPKRDKFQPVPRIRSWFNHGKYGFGRGEDVVLKDSEKSIAYGEDGKPKPRKAFGREVSSEKTDSKPAAKKTGLKAKKRKAETATA